MALTMRSLRWGVVVVAGLLVAVLVGYIGYAKRRAREFLPNLEKRLGIDIVQETDSFTYSQSLKGKTVFTVHAAKELQHRNGVITLKDVGIVLYGASGTRADRIHGQEFEYDQKNGILRAVGQALIDLAPPGDGATDEAHMIHVKTNGLVFRPNEGTAETPEQVEFATGGLVGQSVGAAYYSNTNVLILRSAVRISGLRGERGHERPIVLTATRAEMDRAQNTLLLDTPKYVSATDSGSQSVSAAQATVHTTSEGKPKDVEARGQVQLTGEGLGKVYADRLDTTLNAEGQPVDGHLYGGVRFVSESPARQQQGRAQDVKVAFDGLGRARHAVLVGAVQLDETAGVNSRRLNGEQVSLDFSGGGKQQLALAGASATGPEGARLRVVNSKPGAGQGITATSIRANTLTGRFNGAQLTGLDGFRQTSVERDAYDARGQLLAKETSTGDRLDVQLKDVQLKPSARARMELARAVQTGSVEIVREAAASKPGNAAEVEHAHADQGVYEAADDSLTLSGSAQVSDAASAVYSDWVKLFRGTGVAQAKGSVRVSYVSGKPGTEPMHVLAAAAVSHKDTGVTEFTAAPGAKARMWQGGSQVEAPVLDFDRTKKVVVAHGTGFDADAVRTILVSEPAKPGTKPQPPVRIVSERLTYTDALRQAVFTGLVRVADADGTMRAQEATVFLSPAAAAAPADPAGTLFGGKVERVIGTGAVELEQPGSKATGEKIVYTAADETYVLTGTRAVPPRLVDDVRGTVTGAQLRFKRGDQSVEVVGGDGGRVRSEPRARQ